MTHKDLRDIAAYWGAPCRFLREKKTVDHLVLHTLSERIQSGYHTKKPLTLFLRPISSLTDEEVKHIVSIDSSYPYKAESLSIRRSDNQIYFDTDAGINEWGLLYTGKHRGQIGFHSYAEAQVFAYLQSIHVYVPGTIDEQFVELI